MSEDRAVPPEDPTARPEPTQTPETPIPPPKRDEGADAVDDHVAAAYPRGIGHQPTENLDPSVDGEHLSSPSQGVRPEQVPDRE